MKAALDGLPELDCRQSPNDQSVRMRATGTENAAARVSDSVQRLVQRAVREIELFGARKCESSDRAASENAQL
ncbi:MAG TPA: hypothetical protein VHV08_06980, partial [Pirellulales bacterium]|nr:hypothetical protein [Pirellulales bacterium]